MVAVAIGWKSLKKLKQFSFGLCWENLYIQVEFHVFSESISKNSLAGFGWNLGIIFVDFTACFPM